MLKRYIHNFLYLIFTFSIFTFGIVFTFNYWWNEKIDLSPINGIFTFFTFGFSAMLIANYITIKFIAPKNSEYSFFISDENKLKKIVEKIGMQKYKNTKMINSAIFMVSFIIIPVAFYLFTKYYENRELKNYGIIKEIKIENKSKSYKGFDITTLKYENIEKEFYLNKYEVGETKKIIYSKENPKIAEWYDEFKKNFR